jgi:hypothetical protein
MAMTQQYNPADWIDEICEWIASGQTLVDYCKQPDKPSRRTIYVWVMSDEAFKVRFYEARELGHDVIAEDCLHIADTPLEGQTVTEKAEGVEVKREDMLGHRKLQVWTRLQLLAKWNPKKYGDKVQQEISGKDGGPVQSSIMVEFVRPNSNPDNQG